MTHAAFSAVLGILIVRVVAGCECVKLPSCASCIVGRDLEEDPGFYPLQIMQKPEFMPPRERKEFYDFRTFIPNGHPPCNTTCQWNRANNSCSEISVLPFPVPFPALDVVYPILDGEPDSSRFDVYSRMRACAFCIDVSGQHPSSPSPRR